jgi:hypothetical protein
LRIAWMVPAGERVNANEASPQTDEMYFRWV